MSEIIKEHLPWLIPLLISVLIVGFQIFGLLNRVTTLENISRTKGEQAIEKLERVDARVSRLEEFCCGEVRGFNQFIDGQYQKEGK
jgi:hypothetical protein